jgi:hypothetical protein
LLEPDVSVALRDLEDALDKLLASEEPLDVARLAKVREQMEFVWLRAVGDYDRSGEWAEQGFLNAAAGLRANCVPAPGSPWREVRLSRRLRDLPVMADAFARGLVARAHFAAFADACTQDRLDALREAEAEFARVAQLTDLRQFRNIVNGYAGAFDGDDGASLANDQYQRRRLHLSELYDGMWKLDGLFDAEQGQKLSKWLHRHVARHHKHRDGRTPAQIRADALFELVQCGDAHAHAGPGRNAVTDMSLHIDLRDLDDRIAPDLAADIRRQGQHRHGLAKATLQRLACDARISRIITDGPSEILDVGRASRNGTTAQRRGLVNRDRGCTHPGCDRGPEWCQVHHDDDWIKRGQTNLDDLRLLCDRHHHLYHEGRDREHPP